ncbi:MAG TPA: HlyD family efflux transporter periplasmic adaptor subunit [Candidatus Acidoferrum sp.]|nr:HlyD family efflux transporter periplasmic adaptor subunit [Candidatus Acidoferrum sp.]
MKRKLFIIAAVAIAAVVVAGVYGGWFRKDTGLEGSGTVEARNIRVGSKIGGRILEVRVREGDRVEPGQTLITFDDKELEASLAQARANAQKSARGFRPEEIEEAAAAAKQAKADYDLHLSGYRKEDIAAAQSDLDRTAADETRARLDFQRYDALAQKDLVSKQQRDTAEANWKMSLAAKENAQHKLDELQRGFRPEEIAMAEARYQQAQATLDKMQHGNRREDVQATSAELAYEEARFRERQVLAPSAATVEVLDVRPGDLIAPNTPVATLLESDQIYVRIYVPETELNKVSVGQKAEIRVDPFQKQTFNGVVEQINQQAEFLPRNVQTREERVHQVFGVKVRIDDPSHRVLPGMSADVRLLP